MLNIINKALLLLALSSSILYADNCTLVDNPLQRDTDGDGYGNYCDADLNNDFVVNMNDFFIFRRAYGTADPDADFNGDGTVNLNDFSLFRGMYGSAPGPSCIDTASCIQEIKLSWVAPSEREDNTPILLSEIAGFKIYYGVEEGNYTDAISINDGTLTEYTISDLNPGTYYFVMTTVDTDGRESEYSLAISITQ